MSMIPRRGRLDLRVLALALACVASASCYRDDEESLATDGPRVRIELASGEVDPEGQAVISEQDATNMTPAYAFLDLDEAEHERDGAGWGLQAAIPLDALAYGAEAAIVLPLGPARGVGSQPDLPAVGNATVRRSAAHGEVAEESTSGSVTIRIDVCLRTIEGEVASEPASLSARFTGEIAVTDELGGRCP